MASAIPSYSLSNGIRAPTISFWPDRNVLLMVESMDRSPTDAWRPENMLYRLISRSTFWNSSNS